MIMLIENMVDMEALEAMEGRCLEWAEEEAADQAERIMVRERVFMAVPSWIEQIKPVKNVHTRRKSGFKSPTAHHFL